MIVFAGPSCDTPSFSSDDISFKYDVKKEGFTLRFKNPGFTASTEEKTPGRPQKPDDQKSEKTIQNKESMN